MYYQCQLKEKDGNGFVTGWIEERAAKENNLVELLSDKKWYRVMKVFPHGISAKDLTEHQKLNRNSLPSIK